MTDSMNALKTDIRFILRTRGALRHQPLVRSHFWRRLMELTDRSIWA